MANSAGSQPVAAASTTGPVYPCPVDPGSFCADGRVPLVVGVIGHTDLPKEDRKPAREAVHDRLRELLRRFDRWGPMPLVVVTAGGPGADRLATKAALELRHEDEGIYEGRIHTVVCLPMPYALYRDVLGPAEANDLDAFLRDVEEADGWWHDLPLPDGWTAAQVLGPGPDAERRRNYLYLRVGHYLADHVHVLIALWDGKPGRGPGGTADVVARFRGLTKSLWPGIPDPLWEREGLLFWHIPSRRASGDPFPKDESEEMPVPPEGAEPPPRRETQAQTILRRIATYDRDAAAPTPEEAKSRATNEEYLLEKGPHGADVRRTSGAMLHVYGAADTMARAHQTSHHGYLNGWTTWVAVSIVLFETYAHLWGHPAVLFAFVLAFGASIATVLRARRRFVHERALVYRSLAEALRVQIYWRHAGLDDSVSDHYDRLSRGEVEWVRQALRGLRVLSPDGQIAASAIPPARTEDQRIEDAFTRWCGGQAAWFGDKIKRGSEPAARGEAWKQTLVVGGVVLAAGIALGHTLDAWFGSAGATGHGVPAWAHFFVVLAVLVFAGAGLLHAWMHVNAARETLRRYVPMRKVHLKAVDRQSKSPRSHALTPAAVGAWREETRQVLRAVGTAAIAENTGWLLLHQERHLEISKP